MSDSSSPGKSESTASSDSLKRYWTANVRLMLVLLALWALAGLGCGILFADTLNEFKIGGFPLGFWFAQQGSIVVFVLLILTYCLIMNKRDAKHHEELQSDESQSGGGI